MNRNSLNLELRKLFAEIRTYNENRYLSSLCMGSCPQSCEYREQKHEHVFDAKYIDVQKEWCAKED